MYDEKNDIPTVNVKPNYQATGVEHAVFIPGLQSVFVGLAAGLVMWAVLWLFSVGFVILLKLVFLTFAVATLGSWWFVHYQDALWLIERLTGQDITMDGYIGAPPQHNPSLELTLWSQDHLHSNKYNIPFPEKLPDLLAGLSSGRHFTFAEWGGGGKLYTQPQWKTFTDYLLSKGFIQLKNPRNEKLGYRLTPEGEQVFGEISHNLRQITPAAGGMVINALDGEPPAPAPWTRNYPPQ